MKKQVVSLVLLALLLIAMIFRYDVHPSKMIKTDRWTGVTWKMGLIQERPLLDDPGNRYRAWNTRKTLSYTWFVLTVGAVVWLIKSEKER